MNGMVLLPPYRFHPSDISFMTHSREQRGFVTGQSWSALHKLEDADCLSKRWEKRATTLASG